ncbi:hypothetical protein VKS41_008071 [Umbelopsis sp. WA50703]
MSVTEPRRRRPETDGQAPRPSSNIKSRPARNSITPRTIYKSVFGNARTKRSIATVYQRLFLLVLFAFGIALYLWVPEYYYEHWLAPRSRAFKSKIPVERTVMTMNGTSSHCTVPYGNKPLVQFGLMIDAGSTGSRIHVYKFNNCGPSPALEDEVFVQTIPGLSAYADEPEEAAKSLDVLMQAAVENVPIHLRRCSPVSVGATAGLRLLGEEKSESILAAVRYRLKHHYPFPISKREGVSIMDGRDEGVYAWITVNHLLGNFENVQDDSNRSTAAIFDLGGGSTQIVFEPDLHGAAEPLAEGEHKYELDYGADVYTLYQHSYLGYGLMEARKQIKSYPIKDDDDDQIPHPCLPLNVRLPYKDTDGNDYTLVGLGSGHDECREIVHKILNKNKECAVSPCSFDGIYQPSLMETFAHHPIYIFSYFYDRTKPLGMADKITLGELGALTDSVCSGEYFAQVTDEELRVEMLDRPEWCMDLSYIYGLLRYGYEISDSRQLHIAKKIKGVETGWCLGAAIAMLEDVTFCELDA